MNRIKIVVALAVMAVFLLGACAKPAPAPSPAAPAPAPKPTVAAPAPAPKPTVAAPAPKPAAPAPAPAPQKVVLTAAGPWKITHGWTKLFLQLVDDANKKGEGLIGIEYKGGPELMKAADLLSAAGDGRIDMIFSTAPYYAGMVPENAIMGLNVVEHNINNFTKYRDAIRADVVRINAKKTNTQLLAMFLPTEMVVFTSKKPIKKATDLNGLKIRTSGGWDAASLQALGAAATNIASGEIYTAAQQGIIDGASRPPDVLKEYKEEEVWKYMMANPLRFNDGADLWMNLDKFNKLSPKAKEILLKLVADWEARMVVEFGKIIVQGRKDVIAKGVQEVTMDPGEMEKWNAALAPAAEAYFLKVAPQEGPELIKKLKAAAGK